jgi:hypothetical protein
MSAVAFHCDYLDESHSLFHARPELRARAVALLVREALARSARFRLEFDRESLLSTLGPADTLALLPNLSQELHGGPVEVAEEALDDGRRHLLERVLSFDLQGWSDLPLNSIRRVLLFDAGGDVVLRANDNAEFVLFNLPAEARARLLENFRGAGIPEDVIAGVSEDIGAGER